MDTIIGLFAFSVLTLLWAAFLAALVLKRELLGESWNRLDHLPLVAKIVVVILALPVVVGLWVWQTRWPLWVRLVVVLGLAWVTVYTFFPRFPQA